MAENNSVIKTIIVNNEEKPTAAFCNLSSEDKAELKTAAEAILPLYNEAIQEKKIVFVEVTDPDKKVTTMTLREYLDQAVNAYTAIARKEAFDRILATENPMLTACREQVFASIRIKDATEGENKIPVSTIEECNKDIDLLALNKASKNGGIGADPKWIDECERLNYLMAIKVGQSVGDKKWDAANLKNIEDSFRMSDIAKSLRFVPGKADPLSNTQMLKTLQTVVTHMLGDGFKVTSHDIGWISNAYARKDRKVNTIQLPNHKTFVAIVRDICHNASTGDGYAAVSRCIKTK